MHKFKTLKEFVASVRSGHLDESLVTVTLDNDSITILYNFDYERDDDDDDKYEAATIRVDDVSRGKMDVDKVWEELFPKAKIEWC